MLQSCLDFVFDDNVDQLHGLAWFYNVTFAEMKVKYSETIISVYFEVNNSVTYFWHLKSIRFLL